MAPPKGSQFVYFPFILCIFILYFTSFFLLRKCFLVNKFVFKKKKKFNDLLFFFSKPLCFFFVFLLNKMKLMMIMMMITFLILPFHNYFLKKVEQKPKIKFACLFLATHKSRRRETLLLSCTSFPGS